MVNIKTNINGISYDLNDGGAMCDICDKHLHNCEPHKEHMVLLWCCPSCGSTKLAPGHSVGFSRCIDCGLQAEPITNEDFMESLMESEQEAHRMNDSMMSGITFDYPETSKANQFQRAHQMWLEQHGEDYAEQWLLYFCTFYPAQRAHFQLQHIGN